MMTLPPALESKELLTEIEAALILGLKPQTLSLWRCQKRYGLPYVRVGRLVRYRRADLEKWLESRLVTNGDDN